MRVVVLTLLLCSFVALASAAYRPVVLMHGLFANYEAMHEIQDWLLVDFPGIYVHNADVPVQNNTNGKIDSLLIDLNKQIADFAAQLQADPRLANGFDLIGHSQGGLITRAFIERYNVPRVHNYISLAGPQAGIFGMPDVNDLCPDVDCPWLVDWMNAIAEGGWSEDIFQHDISFAQYWKNPLNYSLYLQTSGFLADANNERAVKNATYKANMLATTGNHTYVMALNDHIVVPKESAWWGFYAIGNDTTLVDMKQTEGYQSDWIGLQSLDQAGRLERIAVNCTHQGLPRAVCKSQVYDAVIYPRVGGQL
jgi:palmitoyl-protein thioesterase